VGVVVRLWGRRVAVSAIPAVNYIASDWSSGACVFLFVDLGRAVQVRDIARAHRGGGFRVEGLRFVDLRAKAEC
jgi:hypothetical protein